MGVYDLVMSLKSIAGNAACKLLKYLVFRGLRSYYISCPGNTIVLNINYCHGLLLAPFACLYGRVFIPLLLIQLRITNNNHT